jgi:hypothetical protein
MKADLVEILERVVQGGDVSDGQEFVGNWAAEHPITGSIPGRPSILREAGTFKTKSGTGGMKLVGGLAVTMDDMLKQIENYTSSIPKQARWEAQLAMMEMVGAENLDRTATALPALLDSAEALGGTIEELPTLVSGEREAILSALRRERIETLEFLRRERLETLTRISAERVAVLEGTDEMRAAATADLRQEVLAIGELIREQRAQTMEEAEGIAGRTMDRTFERALELVDHVFLRVVVLLVLVFVGSVLLVLLCWRLFRRGAATA